MADRDFFVRVPERFKPELERRAQENDRSVAAEVRAILRQAIASNAKGSSYEAN